MQSYTSKKKSMSPHAKWELWDDRKGDNPSSSTLMYQKIFKEQQVQLSHHYYTNCGYHFWKHHA